MSDIGAGEPASIGNGGAKGLNQHRSHNNGISAPEFYD